MGTLVSSFSSLLDKVTEQRKQGKPIVLCHGHFNVIHPGHLRFLNFAKSHGDLLVVSILNDSEIPGHLKQDFFSQKERAEGVASLEMVDCVYPLPGSVVELIDGLKPEFYIKGREFEKNQMAIASEIKAVERGQGKVIFSSGEVAYASLSIFNDHEPKHENKKLDKFLKICEKHEISLKKIEQSIAQFEGLKMLVIGDTIVDQFVACDALGVSSEAPVLAIRELESKEFIGGAAIIARHLKSLGANGHYLSVIGQDEPGKFVRDTLDQNAVRSFLYTDEERPTTFKIRYMVENQKILRVSRLKQHDISSELEEKIIGRLEDLVPQMKGIIISDFVYGVITKNILAKLLELAHKHNVKVFGDLQCSSQVGDVSKFKGIELVTPTEKEARIAMGDYTSGLERVAHNFLEKTHNKYLAVTLGANGVLVYDRNPNGSNHNSEYFPALEENPLDVAGAGDTLLAGYALGLCSGLNIFEATVLGSCLAAITVKRIGNIPVSVEEITQYLRKLQAPQGKLDALLW